MKMTSGSITGWDLTILEKLGLKGYIVPLCPAGNSSGISSGLTKDQYYSPLSYNDWNTQRSATTYNIKSAVSNINDNQYEY